MADDPNLNKTCEIQIKGTKTMSVYGTIINKPGQSQTSVCDVTDDCKLNGVNYCGQWQLATSGGQEIANFSECLPDGTQTDFPICQDLLQQIGGGGATFTYCNLGRVPKGSFGTGSLQPDGNYKCDTSQPVFIPKCADCTYTG